jgi:hypothetical protein
MFGNIGFIFYHKKSIKVKKEIDINKIKKKSEHLKKFENKFAILIF